MTNCNIDTLGNRMTPDELRARLAELGWTQRHLARMLGVTDRTVSRWATGALAIPIYCQRYLAPPFYALIKETITVTEHARPGYRFYRVVTPSVAREYEIPCDADVDLEGEDLVRYSELQELAEAHGTAIESNPYRTL